MTLLSRGRHRLRLVVPSVCILVFIGLSLVGKLRAEAANPTSSHELAFQQQTEWPKHAVEGISYEVASTYVRGELGKPGSRQVMFLFLEPNEFTQDRALRVFRHISTQVPRQTTLFVTILTDRNSLSERLQNRRWESSLDDEYSRLTDQPQHCCPAAFKGAQIERYTDRSYILVCDNGKAKEICVGLRCGP
jgi:hypothetical protein